MLNPGKIQVLYIFCESLSFLRPYVLKNITKALIILFKT